MALSLKRKMMNSLMRSVKKESEERSQVTSLSPDSS